MEVWKGRTMQMNFQLDFIEDKVEFFEAPNLKTLQKKIETQIDENRAILLGVHSVSHQMHVNVDGQTYFSAVVHFKKK
jgi:hypothetical protein